MDGSVRMVTSCKYLEVPHCIKSAGSKDAIRSVFENCAAPFSEKKKKLKKLIDLIGTARYIPNDYCFGSKARIPLGLSNEIRQNSSQTVPLDWPRGPVGIQPSECCELGPPDRTRLRRVPQQQPEGFRGEIFHNSSWKSWRVHRLRSRGMQRVHHVNFVEGPR